MQDLTSYCEPALRYLYVRTMYIHVHLQEYQTPEKGNSPLLHHTDVSKPQPHPEALSHSSLPNPHPDHLRQRACSFEIIELPSPSSSPPPPYPDSTFLHDSLHPVSVSLDGNNPGKPDKRVSVTGQAWSPNRIDSSPFVTPDTQAPAEIRERVKLLVSPHVEGERENQEKEEISVTGCGYLDGSLKNTGHTPPGSSNELKFKGQRETPPTSLKFENKGVSNLCIYFNYTVHVHVYT